MVTERLEPPEGSGSWLEYAVDRMPKCDIQDAVLGDFWARKNAMREAAAQELKHAQLCVDACVNLSTKALEGGVVEELLETLREACQEYDGCDECPVVWYRKAKLMLAKAERNPQEPMLEADDG